MIEFVLDTNAVIALINDPGGPVASQARAHHASAVALPSVVVHELFFGAFKSQRVQRNLQIVESLRLEILPFELEDARSAGEIRAWLARHGTPIGAYDVLIAGQARARGLTLVSNNLREFQRVPQLRVVDWSA